MDMRGAGWLWYMLVTGLATAIVASTAAAAIGVPRANANHPRTGGDVARRADDTAVDAVGIDLPDRSATNPESQPARVDHREKSSLDARYRAALKSELGLLKTLDELDEKADTLETSLSRLGLDRATATDALREAELRRSRAELRLAEMRHAVRARLRAILRLGRAPELRFAVSPSGFASAVVQERLLGRLIDGDRGRLARYREQLGLLETETSGRNTALQRLSAADRDLHAQLAALERARHDKMALIAQIEADPIYNAHARRDLDAADRDLVEKIETFKGWQERRYTFGRTRGKLLRPLNMSRVEVPFGPRKHPKFGTTTFHRGIDLRANRVEHNDVRAVFWGRVAFVGWLLGYGDTIVLDHSRGWHTVYAHVEQISVEVGDVVSSRQKLAKVGASGSLKGRYLYFEIRENGVPVDPSEFFN
jgi:murein hydrolase activator